MAKIVFRLNGVPDDEADDVRGLLEQAGIGYFETPAGIFGFSLAALWVDDPAQYRQARRLIDEYQARRTASAREEYERRRAAGISESLFHRIARRPFWVLIYLAAIGFVLYFSLKPFIDFGR